MLDDASFLDEEILEPIAEGHILRTMSDVLLGLDTPEEVISPVLEVPQHDLASEGISRTERNKLAQGRSPNGMPLDRNADYAAFTVAQSLLAYLDFAA
jgi:hypothetical protein